MESKAKILVIDDEQGLRDMLSYELDLQQYSVITAANGKEGIEKVKKEKFDLAILDLKMPGPGGVETLEQLKKIDPDMEVIVATGYGTIETAVESMKKGAYDYINKPFHIDELTVLIQKALEKKDLKIAATLFEASKIIFSSLDLGELLHAIIGLAMKMTEADDISIMLYNTDEKLYIAASYKLDKEIEKKKRLEIGERIARTIMENREPVLLNNGLGSYPVFADIPALATIKSAIVCPLLTKIRLLGMINLNRIDIPYNFNHADLQNVAVFASQISQAIENARLYKGLETNIEEIKKAYGKLDETRLKLVESHNFIESVIGSMTDAFAVVDTRGKIIKANQALISLFASRDITIGKKQVPGMDISDFLPVENIFGERSPEQFIIKTPISNVEINYRLNKKNTVPLSLSAAPVFDTKSGIAGTVMILRDISLQKETEKSLKYLASHDILTDLPNRILLNDRVSQAIFKANRYNHFVAILLLDLDRFKEVNDTMGHEAGDCLLKEVAGRLKTCLREYDTIARMGGDEFVLVIAEINNNNEIEVIADRVLKAFEKPISICSREFHITTSIGISLYPNDGDDIEILLKNADIAMYAAKKLGGNRLCFFKSSMGKISEKNIIIKNDLINAIKKNEFILHYQPLFETDTGKIIAAEALIRWAHPSLGLVQPLHFITIAETNGLIIPIGEWVLRTACEQCKTWHQEGFDGLPVSVNISTRQLYDANLLNIVIEILHESGLSPEYLILEITESSAMQNIENSIQVIKQLHEYGVQIFLDDFGSGYSSFNWLKVLPVQAIKIDRFFIQHIVDDPFDAAIVRAIVSMAHSINIKVIAEGVENIGQLNFLKSIKFNINSILKCDEVQGYLFSRPLPAHEFMQLLASHKK